MAVCDPTDSAYQAVHKLIDENEAFFLSDESEAGQRLHGGLGALRDGLEQVAGLCTPIRNLAPSFDFSHCVPGNGFRSLCHICDAAVQNILSICSKMAAGRGSIVFRKMHFVREVEAWTQALAALCTLLSFATDSMIPLCAAPDGDLVTVHSIHQPQEIIRVLSTVPLHAFYGRCLAFHYVSSLHKTLQLLNISLSAFSQAYYSDGNMWSKTRQSIMASGQYIMSPEARSRRLVSVMQRADVAFIKAFWDLAETEVMRQLPSLVSPALAIYQAFSVPCEEQTLPMWSVDTAGQPANSTVDASNCGARCGGTENDPESHGCDGLTQNGCCSGVSYEGGPPVVVVPPPSSHIPPAPVTCYLLSTFWRRGMPGAEGVKLGTVRDPSPCLIIHCHGGGFVTQSTKSQEMFLREWVSGCGCPLLSIDYSLSPTAPYPRPLEEVLMVYAWALSHLPLLGTTGRRIVLTGDSAGGNLITGLTLRCLQLGLRPPDGLFLAYTPTMLKVVPSPSKLLAVMDPMLPLSFALRCLKAYAGHPSITSPSDPISKADLTLKPNSVPSTNELSKTQDVGGTKKNNTANKRPPSITSSCDPLSSSIFIDGDMNVDENGVVIDGNGSRPSPLFIVDSDDESNLNLLNVEGGDVSTDVLNASRLCLLSPSVPSEADSDTLTTVSLTSNVSRSRLVEGLTELRKEDSEERLGSEDAGQKEDRSRKYVAEFLKKYVMDTRTDHEGRSVPVLRTEGSTDSASDSDTVSGVAPSYCSSAGVATKAISEKFGAAKDAVTGLSSSLSAGLSSVVGFSKKTDGAKKEEDSSCASVASPSPVDEATPDRSSCSPLSECHLPSCLPTLLEEFEDTTILDDPFLNTLEAPHHLLRRFPPTSIMTVEYDFCLDDGVCFAKLLRSLGVSVTLDILPGLPHGFLNLCYLAPETKQGCRRAVDIINVLLGPDR